MNHSLGFNLLSSHQVRQHVIDTLQPDRLALNDTEYAINWSTPPTPHSLLHIPPTAPTTTLHFTPTGLNGNITSYQERQSTNHTNTSLNSTALDRQPGSKVFFVRGKSSNFPFRPGGLGDTQLDQRLQKADTTTGIENAFDKASGNTNLPL